MMRDTMKPSIECETDAPRLHVSNGLLIHQQAIFDNAGIGILFVRGRRILQCNKEASRLFGWPHAEIAGQRAQVCHAGVADYERFDRVAAAALVKGERFETELALVRRDASRFWAHVTGCRVDRHDPHAGTIWIVQDVSAHRFTDELTGLPNRRLVLERLAQALANARRSGEQVAVLLLDLDRFKPVNDSLGRAVGDELLRAVARRIGAVARDGDTVARLGCDEFVIVLPGIGHDADVAASARKAMQALAMPLHVQGRALHVTPSIGIALFPADGETPDTLLRNADAAMVHAKAAGRGNVQRFTPHMNTGAALRFELENDLHHALGRDELFLEYQPRVDLADGSFQGVEALVRWRHPRRGTLPPASFVPLVEEAGLIVRLGEWILRRACRQIVEWQEQCGEAIAVAVNLAPRQFQQPQVTERIGAILADAGVSPDLIELEITESTLMQHTEQTIATLEQLHRMGLRIAIDDFGIGYSSLGYLRRFPVAQLKIDQSFVRELGTDRTYTVIVSAIAALARDLGLSVVAEGVETVEQLDAVRRCGCGQAQGFLFSRPVAPAKVPLMLRRNWLKP